MLEIRDTVTLIDDDPSVREAIAGLLEAHGYVVVTHDSAESYLAAHRPAPGCVILDIRMPGLGGLGLFSRLQEDRPNCPVIFLTGHGDVPMAVNAMKNGALEFLTKPVDEADLIEAVDRALEVHRRRRIRRGDAEHAQTMLAELTPRETEVFRHVIGGALNKEIAAALGIAEQTVKIHRGHLTGKLGIDRVTDLLDLAGRAGVDPIDRSLQ